MKRILAFSGSNHSVSINQQLIEITASLVESHKVYVLDIRKWDIPIYSIDMDPDQTPVEIEQLIELIKEYEGFIISSPEHNSGTPAFFKNILDWLSRRSDKIFDGKEVLLMSTSPGRKGGIANRMLLENRLPFMGANVVSTYSLPLFYQNVRGGKKSGEFLTELQNAVNRFNQSLYTNIT